MKLLGQDIQILEPELKKYVNSSEDQRSKVKVKCHQLQITYF